MKRVVVSPQPGQNQRCPFRGSSVRGRRVTKEKKTNGKGKFAEVTIKDDSLQLRAEVTGERVLP